MINLDKLLHDALLERQDNIQKPAEAKLIEMRENYTSAFMIECMKIFYDPARDPALRVAASTVLGRSAVTKSNVSGNFYWSVLDEAIKLQIKSNLIDLLMSPELQVIRSASSTLAQVSTIEIASGKWIDLITVMAENVGNQIPSIKRVSIQTIGFICQELKFFSGQIGGTFSIPPTVAEPIFAGIILGTRSTEANSEDMIETALEALDNSMSLLKPIIGNKEVRDEIMKIILERINTKFIKQCYQCIVEFATNFYEYLFEYMNPLIEAT